ncbi:MupA/Atu3671 family FMN-dependent luciferase-like monooxygenase [Silicimonas sp. MF1-12-2]|uniref:MupA/Atu3671 family FMN-dependent luciferase-like monooxygenase n=1 Tax=Silicimonas sp. MF1-12-2 TaxID=3384793 RepID=UPI0039B6528B
MRLSCFLIGHENLAIECGKRLLSAGHEIRAVASHRAEVADWARGAGLEVCGALDALPDGPVDWLFSVANLQMIPDAILARAESGAVNFHDGPLPRYAGLNAPVWAIAAGETSHGITWHLMATGADRGDILVQREVPIADDETAFTLNAKCFAAGVESFDAVLAEIEAGLPGRRAQDFSERSYFGRTHRPIAGGCLDFTASPGEIARLVRALDHGGYDNPVGSAWIRAASGPVLVGHAEEVDGEGAPGEVLEIGENALVVAASGGALRLSGLRDPLGAALRGSDVAGVGETLEPVRDGDGQERALSDVASGEAEWRARMSDYRPADWPIWPDGDARAGDAVIDPAGQKAETVAAAFAALVARMSGGEAIDLALASESGSKVAAHWMPVRFDPDGGWSRAFAASSQEMEAAQARGPFAFDLPARIAGLEPRRMPAAAISSAGAVEGAAVTLVLGGDGAMRLLGDAASVSAGEVARIAARLSHLLARLGALAPDAEVSALPILPEAERETVVAGFNDTAAEYDADLCIHRAFEAQAARTPDATALVFEDMALTYGELNARANRLAHVLIGMGVGPGKAVGLHMTRRTGLVVGALAILKAGGAYVPLDPGYPAERIAFYAADSGAGVILSETGLPADPVPEGAVRLLADADPRIAAAPATNPETGVGGGDLAYLIYTSGSTGTPKGVMIEHRNVSNFFTGMDRRIDRETGDVWLSVTSLSFDISVLELFWTLARGFKVVLLGDEKMVADGGGETAGKGLPGGMEFSLFYWGNDDAVGRDKYAVLLEGAQYADQNGFQAVWTPERHFHAFGGLYPNPSVTGAAAAAVTRNLAVRAGSVVAPLHHPARIAEEWAVIDNLTNGRAGLAIASGWHPDDFVLRPENAPPNNKAAVFDAIRDLRKLWAGEPLAMTRADGTVVEKVTQPRPVSKELEMWLTIAGNPEAWRQAGEAGVHVLTHLLGQSISDVKERIGIYHDALRASGRDPKDYKVTLMLHTYLAETRERSMEVAREPMKAYLKAAADLIKQYAWAFPAFKKPAGVETPHQLDLGGLTEDELEDILEFAFLRYFETSGLFGTVEDALERVAELKEIGVTEVACLVDYGIARQTIMDGLHLLADVRRAANAEVNDHDFSMAAQIARHGVTHLQCTPYMARMLVENTDAARALGRVKHLMIGGEALPAALVRDLKAVTGAGIQNMYGPTETTIWSATGPGTDADAIVSVGKPIANTQLYVLDARREPVGIGQTGELWIGGAGVSRGYWRREDLTAEKFVENPFHGGRMFGTGDLARWRPDGTLDFLGRRDNQIKIRGYRIEIGEIEAAMEAVPGVSQAVAVVREDASGVGQILGFVTGSVDETALRKTLAARLPAFMVPARLTVLERFPQTPNGKIDRKALPDPAMTRAVPAPEPVTADASAGASSTVTMEEIGAVWARVLNVPAPGAADNFFDLGGHSLLAIEVHRMLKSDLGIKGLSIADIFRAPTLGGLHAVVQRLGAGPVSKVRAETQRRDAVTVPPAEVVARPVSDAGLVSRRRALRAGRTAEQ